MDLPKHVERGDVARLFPVIAETSKEQKASSILLSVMSAVPAFANSLLIQLGQKIGNRTVVNTFTEVQFQNDVGVKKSNRPDGLIQVDFGKRTWSALLEAKIGNNELDSDQIERYMRLARENELDAVITISNQFAATPAHHPVAIPKQLTRKVSLFHFSWTAILTEAVLIHERKELADKEQAFLIREFVRFFSHPSAGVSGFTSMPQQWTEAVEKIQVGGRIVKGDIGVPVVGAWHQELRDLSLYMSRIIGCGVSTKISRTHAGNADQRLRDDVDKLCRDNVLHGSLQVPNAAADIGIVVDLRSRTLRVSMLLDAPKDKKSNRARLNWLMRQLRKTEAKGVSIGARWPSRAQTTVCTLAELRDKQDDNEINRSKFEVRSFEVIVSSQSARRFSGKRTFIEELESLVPYFYEQIGQHLQAWKPSPPKPKHSVSTRTADMNDKPVEVITASAGNDHAALMEIPEFLRRLSQ